MTEEIKGNSDASQAEQREGETVKFIVHPSMPHPDGPFTGQPVGYSLSPDEKREKGRGPLELILMHLFEEDAFLFTDSSSSPQENKERAESVKTKLEEPKIQQRLKDLYAEKIELEKEIQRKIDALNAERKQLEEEIGIDSSIEVLIDFPKQEGHWWDKYKE